MSTPPGPTLRAIVLMYDAATGGLTLQFPPELPLQLVLHTLTTAAQTIDASIRSQNGLIIPPKRGDGTGK